MFTPDERVAMIAAVFRRYGGRVVADRFTGLLVDYVERMRAKVIVRGLRAVADFEYEFQMTMMNRHLKSDIETIFMMAGEAHFYTSSRLVKEVVTLGGDVEGLVPDVVLKRLKEKVRS
jgi:pantetheine-phosphate adenylyltransferase